MPAYRENIGRKALRVALPVVTLGSLCFAATGESQSKSNLVTTEKAPAASGFRPQGKHEQTARFISGNALFLSGLKLSHVLNLDGDPDRIYKPAQKKPEATQPVPPRTYMVRPGDSVLLISEELKINPFNFMKDNNIKPEDTIFAGEIFKIPDPNEPPAPPVSFAPASQELVSQSQGTSSSNTAGNTAPGAAGPNLNSSMWQCIREAESNDEYNNPAKPSGAYGILFSTWDWMAGAGFPEAANYARPYEAPPSVQDAAALFLFAKNGYKYGGTWNDYCTGT